MIHCTKSCALENVLVAINRACNKYFNLSNFITDFSALDNGIDSDSPTCSSLILHTWILRIYFLAFLMVNGSFATRVIKVANPLKLGDMNMVHHSILQCLAEQNGHMKLTSHHHPIQSLHLLLIPRRNDQRLHQPIDVEQTRQL